MGKSKDEVMMNAEEIADKLKECLALVEPNLEAKSMAIRDAVDLLSEDAETFTRACIEYLGTDSTKEIINVMEDTWHKEGSQK